MGIFVLIFSLIALFTVSGGPAKMGALHSPMDSAYLAIPKRTFEPPARKSMIVDAEGQAYRTADGTQMTKRDRAKMTLSTPRTFEYKIPVVAPQIEKPVVETVSEPAAVLDVVTQAETKTVEDLSVPMMPDTLPVEAPEVATDPVMNQKILSSIMALDGNLSEWARVTLRSSFREGLVILYGVVRDEQEKQHIAELTKSLPDVVTVENQLNTVGAETEATQVLTQ